MIYLKNFTNTAENVRTREMKENDKGNLNQRDRNAVKHDVIEALMKDFPEGTVVGRATEGIIVELPHEHFGSITIVVDAKVKNMDFDSESALHEFAEKERKAKERAEQRKKDTAESIRQTKARKAKESKE